MTNELETYKFTSDQLIAMLHGTIGLYLEYRRMAYTEILATDSSIVVVIQGLEADKQLSELGLVPKTLQE